MTETRIDDWLMLHRWLENLLCVVPLIIGGLLFALKSPPTRRQFPRGRCARLDYHPFTTATGITPDGRPVNYDFCLPDGTYRNIVTGKTPEQDWQESWAIIEQDKEWDTWG
jgi:hypothetical protein